MTGNSKFKVQNSNSTRGRHHEVNVDVTFARMRSRPCLHVACCILNCVILTACSGSTDFERMRQQQRADPYGQSAVFADGMVMQAPPEGTVPIDQRIAGSRPGDLLPRGEHQFQIFCAVCHGADGSGHSVMAANLPDSTPSLLIGHAVESSDSELLDVLSHGRNRMPAFDWAMPAVDRQSVVAFVRMLQQKGDAVPQTGTR